MFGSPILSRCLLQGMRREGCRRAARLQFDPPATSRCDGLSLMSWSRRFDEPIELPDGRKLRTLKEVIAWLAKEIPKSEHGMKQVQVAADMVTKAAENNGPLIFARMGTMQAINRHRVREFDTSRKPHHLGETKAQEGPMKATRDSKTS
jgi:hypothetical protein